MFNMKTCPLKNVTAPYLYYTNLTRKIQYRLTTILNHLPHRNKQKGQFKLRADRRGLEVRGFYILDLLCSTA